jgi:hypothetical protein
VDRVTLQARRFLEQGKALFALAPLQQVKLRRPVEVLLELAACPALARVRALNLNFGNLGGERARTLLSSPYLRSLQALDLGNNRLGIAGFQTVLPALEKLRQLTDLALDDNLLKDSGARRLASSAWVARLTRLNLAGNGLRVAGVQALAASVHLEGLQSLDLSRNTDFGQEGLEALLASPHLGQLTELSLNGCRVGPEGAALLLASPLVARLTDLNLGRNTIGDKAYQEWLARFVNVIPG